MLSEKGSVEGEAVEIRLHGRVWERLDCSEDRKGRHGDVEDAREAEFETKSG